LEPILSTAWSSISGAIRGLLNEAVAVGDMFLEKGQLIVSYHGRSPRTRFLRRARQSGHERASRRPVNTTPASAAEIVSGAIQDHDRGLLRSAKTTFGKGLVQTVQRFLKTPA